MIFQEQQQTATLGSTTCIFKLCVHLFSIFYYDATLPYQLIRMSISGFLFSFNCLFPFYAATISGLLIGNRLCFYFYLFFYFITWQFGLIVCDKCKQLHLCCNSFPLNSTNKRFWIPSILARQLTEKKPRFAYM